MWEKGKVKSMCYDVFSLTGKVLQCLVKIGITIKYALESRLLPSNVISVSLTAEKLPKMQKSTSENFARTSAMFLLSLCFGAENFTRI